MLETFFTNDVRFEGEVKEINPINEEGLTGELKTIEIPGYGTAVFSGGDESANTERRRKYSMMPEKYINKTAKDFDWDIYDENTDTLKNIANAFVVNFKDFAENGRGLYIFSETKGSGKTFLSCCLANEILERRDISVKFINSQDYIKLSSDKGLSSEDKIQSIKTCGLLILDDLGAEADSRYQWVSASISRLIEYRYNNRLPIIFTSNFEMDKLPEDSRVIDRIIGISVPVFMPEESIRRKQAEERTRDFLDSVLCKSDDTDIFDE